MTTFLELELKIREEYKDYAAACKKAGQRPMSYAKYADIYRAQEREAKDRERLAREYWDRETS